MKVSAIIPTFNRRDYVTRAVDSVLAQTVPVDEIIVVDDGSTDGTIQTIRSRYGSRVAVLRQENAGASAARNRGLREARGEWIAFLDSDDVWSPTKIERQLEALATLGDGFGACFTDCKYMGSSTSGRSAFERAGLETNSDFGELSNPMKYITGMYPVIYMQSLMVSRSLHDEVNWFDEALVVEEDVDLNFRLAFRTKFCFVSEPLVTIDDTRSRDRLTGLYAGRTDRVFACIEHRHQKWLAFPSVDADTRQMLHQSLRHLYYTWAISRLYQFRICAAVERLSKARAMGDSYLAICSMLASRTTAKLLSAVRGR